MKENVALITEVNALRKELRVSQQQGHQLSVRILSRGSGQPRLRWVKVKSQTNSPYATVGNQPHSYEKQIKRQYYSSSAGAKEINRVDS